METLTARVWMFLQLQVALFGRLDSSSLPRGSAPAVVSSLVGSDALLPCRWTSRLRPGSLPVPHVQWCLESLGTVLEQQGAQRWTTLDFSDRAEVLEAGLGSGDCSLLIRDVQVTDGGQYDSYMILDQYQDQTKNGVFISSVKLLVFDHSSVESKRPGEDLVLDLHTPQAMSLVFQGSNSSEWVSLWQRDVLGSPRLQKDPVRERLTLGSVSVSDEGDYKVLDGNGLTVSSTRLSVGRDGSTALKFTQEHIVPRGDAVKHMSSTRLIALSSFLVPFLLLLL